MRSYNPGGDEGGGRVRILVVEDDEDVALMEQRALEAEGHDVSVCSTGESAVATFVRWQPDLILLDHGLPDIAGAEVIGHVRERSQIPIVVVTGRSASEAAVSSFDLGADDYVVKPFDPAELMARVRAVLRRTAPSTHEPLMFKDLTLDPGSRRVTRRGEEIALTRIEFDILELLMRRLGDAVGRDEIAKEIWQLPAERIGKSLDVHVSVLRRKLGDDPKRPAYIETVRSIGFRLAG